MTRYAAQEMPLWAAAARKNNPEPSQIAAAYMNTSGTTKTHAQMILKAMRRTMIPMTAIDLARNISAIDRIEISRRLSGLKKAGMVEVCGSYEHDGTKYSLWRIKES